MSVTLALNSWCSDPWTHQSSVKQEYPYYDMNNFVIKIDQCILKDWHMERIPQFHSLLLSMSLNITILFLVCLQRFQNICLTGHMRSKWYSPLKHSMSYKNVAKLQWSPVTEIKSVVMYSILSVQTKFSSFLELPISDSVSCQLLLKLCE